MDDKVRQVGELPRSTRACDTKCDGCWITKCNTLVDYQGPQEPATQSAMGVGLQSATHWWITKVHKSLWHKLRWVLDYKVQHIGWLPKSTRACDRKSDGFWSTKCNTLMDYQSPQELVTQSAMGVGLQSATKWITKCDRDYKVCWYKCNNEIMKCNTNKICRITNTSFIESISNPGTKWNKIY